MLLICRLLFTTMLDSITGCNKWFSMISLVWLIHAWVVFDDEVTPWLCLAVSAASSTKTRLLLLRPAPSWSPIIKSLLQNCIYIFIKAGLTICPQNETFSILQLKRFCATQPNITFKDSSSPDSWMLELIIYMWCMLQCSTWNQRGSDKWPGGPAMTQRLRGHVINCISIIDDFWMISKGTGWSKWLMKCDDPQMSLRFDWMLWNLQQITSGLIQQEIRQITYCFTSFNCD